MAWATAIEARLTPAVGGQATKQRGPACRNPHRRPGEVGADGSRTQQASAVFKPTTKLQEFTPSNGRNLLKRQPSRVAGNGGQWFEMLNHLD